MRIKSIQTRLLLIILPFVILSFAVLSGASYYLSQKALSTSVDETAKATGADYAKRVQGDMQILITQLEGLASTQIIQNGDKSQVVAAMKQALTRLDRFDNFLLMSSDGSGIRSDGTTDNFSNREYFKAVMTTQKPYISNPTVAKSTGKISVVIAVPIAHEGRLIGVLGANFSLLKMSELVKDLKFKDSGYGVLVDDSGLVIANPQMPQLVGKLNYTQKKINPELKEKRSELDDRMMAMFQEAVKTDKQVSGEYYYVDDILKTAVYTPVDLPGDQRWVMVVATPKEETTRETVTLAKTLTIISLIFCALAVAFVALISRRFAAPIKILLTECQLIAQGDFRDLEAKINSEDEIGELAKGFREMRANVRGLVRQVQSQAEQVAASSEELTASSEQSAQAANQIANSIAEVANGADMQLAAAGETSAVMEQMSASIQQVAANTNQVAVQSAQAADKAQGGSKLVEKAVNQMDHIEETVNASAQVVAKLGERSKEIGQIVDTIAGIAGQTNLLALNAAIEAARAGEQGRGFAVVAEEVRKLAEQSQDAARKIADLIGDIQCDTDKAVVAMNEGSKEVKTGAEVVNIAGNAFQEIVELVSHVSQQVQEVSSAVQQMASGAQQVVESVKKIDALSKTSAGEAQSVSAATEEQLASMEEISSSSQSLAKLAQDLQDAVRKFTV